MKRQLSKTSFATAYALAAKPKKHVPLCRRCGSRTAPFYRPGLGRFEAACLKRPPCRYPSS